MNKPHFDCTHCGSSNTDYRGLQKGVDLPTRRWFQYPLVQCDGCGTSFGVKDESRWLDTDELVSPKTEMAVRNG
jgi:hypothetical protein